MKPNDDITEFWLAWRKTCAIRLCLDAGVLKSKCSDVPEVVADVDKVVDYARAVIETTNRYFAGMVRSPRTVKALKRFASKVDESSLEDDGEEDSVEAGGEDSANENARSDDGRSVFRNIPGGATFADVQEKEDDAVDPQQGQYRDRALGRGKMVSEYRDLVDAWYQHDENAVSAFELVEIDLYREAAEKTLKEGGSVQGEPMLNGRKLKDYLFEDVCAATGNICQSLWGYLLKKDPSPQGISRLRIVANKSFRNPVEDRPVVAKDGKPDARERPDPERTSGDEDIEVRQAGVILRDYWSSRWTASFDDADRVALCCAFFEYTMSDPFVLGLVPVKMSSFNTRKNKRVGEVFSALKGKGCDFETVRELFRGKGQEILRELAEGDRVCGKLIEHFDKLRKLS